MEILVFKTNIHTEMDIRRVRGIFMRDKDILSWNVDKEDVDNVLRIEAAHDITKDVETVLSKAGYYCKELE